MLKKVLIANAVSCALFGMIFLFAGASVVTVIGDPPRLLVQVLGAGLVVNALLLSVTARNPQPDKARVLFFSVGDALWVVGTLILLVSGTWINTPVGIVLALLVAVFVGGCGFVQWRTLPDPK